MEELQSFFSLAENAEEIDDYASICGGHLFEYAISRICMKRRYSIDVGKRINFDMTTLRNVEYFIDRIWGGGIPADIFKAAIFVSFESKPFAQWLKNIERLVDLHIEKNVLSAEPNDYVSQLKIYCDKKNLSFAINDATKKNANEFIFCATFEGETFYGNPAPSKKMAKQNAAFCVVKTLGL